MAQEGERLDSWKEIAAYLGRDLRTVRRWEQRGLPVHRVPGGERRAVFAYRKEIDGWLNELESADRGPLNPSAGPAPSKNWSGQAGFQLDQRPVLLAVAVFIVLIIVVAGFALRPRAWRTETPGASITQMTLANAVDGPRISMVTPILARAEQRIVIQGEGFGLHVPYARTDSPFLAIRDKTAHWAAGRIVPQNWDEINVDVESWRDTQIVINGFSGAYGAMGWTLNEGDEVEIVVWNPQSGMGPATYHATVSAKAPEK